MNDNASTTEVVGASESVSVSAEVTSDALQLEEVPTDNTTECPATNSKSRKPKKIPPAFLDFNANLYGLLVFRTKHNHCRVPSADPLYSWVEYVRRSHRQYVTDERKEVLNSIGFIWQAPVRPAHQGAWEKMYQELVAYRHQHGHTRVPQNQGKMGKFVQHQRNLYRLREQKADGFVLPDDRREKLNAIGFEWQTRNRTVFWEDRFQQLVDFQRRFGHTNVAQGWKENINLGRWVMKQRVFYNQIQRNQKKYGNALTPERIARLNDIGFLWVGPSNVSNKNRQHTL